MSELNGRQSLDLTEFIEKLHVKAGEIEFDLPLDLSIPLLGRMQSVGSRLEKAETLDDDALTALDADLWTVADMLLERAVPPPGPARDFLTLTAFLQMVRFLTAGFASASEPTMPSPSPTTTEEPSPSPISSEAAPS